MTAAERIYQLVNSLPAEQVNEILDFAESLCQKQTSSGLLAPQLSLRQIAALPLEQRHQLLASSIAATADDFKTDPELVEFSLLDTADWIEDD
jgi:hypothetical protein